MALVVVSRNPLDGGMIELTLSDGTNRLTITVPPGVESAPESQALLEVMFNTEQARLATARRASKPGQAP
jgi:hypothetical protein